MRKKLPILLLSIILFIGVVAVGLATLFVVDTVQIYFTQKTEAGAKDYEELEERLNGACKGKNILFFNESGFDEVFSSLNYVKKVSVRKIYPDKVVVYAEEIEEIYAVKNADGSFDMLDENGSFLSSSDKNENRADGCPNILLEKFVYENGAFRDEEIFSSAKEAVKFFSDKIPRLKNNLVSVSYIIPTTSAADAYFEFVMTEGVRIKIVNPLSDLGEKSVKGIEKYISLSVEEKMCGVITVVENKLEQGEISVYYTSE